MSTAANDATLLRMAHEIARNLASQYGDAAASSTAEHLRNFWAPRMRRQLIELVRSGHDAAPVVRDAVALLERR